MFKNKKLLGILLCVSLLFCSVFALIVIPSDKSDSKGRNTVNVEQRKNDEKKADDMQKQVPVNDENQSNQGLDQENKVRTENTKKTDSSSGQKTSKNGISSQNQNSSQNEVTSSDSTTTNEQYVTLSIDCKTILNNINQLPEQYKSCVPGNGIILPAQKVKIQEDDTVFDVVLRVTKQKRIPLAQSNGYIQSINALPEKIFNGSGGWMYSVNGTFANTGCKEYRLKDNDKIEWRYTCYIGDLY